MGVYVSWTKATEDEESFLFRCSHSFVTRFFLALVLLYFVSLFLLLLLLLLFFFFSEKGEAEGEGGRVSETRERIEKYV